MMNIFIKCLYFIIPGVVGTNIANFIWKIRKEKRNIRKIKNIFSNYILVSIISIYVACFFFFLINELLINEFYYFDTFDYIFKDGNFGMLELLVECLIAIKISYILSYLNKDIFSTQLKEGLYININKNNNAEYSGKIKKIFIDSDIRYIILENVEINEKDSNKRIKEEIDEVIIPYEDRDIIEITCRGNK